MTAKDPVCGMMVDEQVEAPVSEYKGRTFYFCSEACKRAFDANPPAYAE